MTQFAPPPRTPWGDFTDVLIHATESAVKQHAAYRAAKSGSGEAALVLVNDTLSEQQNRHLQVPVGERRPKLVSAHAYEREGVNAYRKSWPMN
jgi:hypothetical protein